MRDFEWSRDGSKLLLFHKFETFLRISKPFQPPKGENTGGFATISNRNLATTFFCSSVSEFQFGLWDTSDTTIAIL